MEADSTYFFGNRDANWNKNLFRPFITEGLALSGINSLVPNRIARNLDIVIDVANKSFAVGTHHWTHFINKILPLIILFTICGLVRSRRGLD
jgi:hypothetical protein